MNGHFWKVIVVSFWALRMSCSIFAQETEPAASPAPMAAFERMMTGDWRMTMQSGHSQYETWSWGPGQHSARRQTEGFGAAGEPWRALNVVYWHPGLNEIRLLGLSPFAQGVSEGVMSFDGDTADATLDLYQTMGRREMRRQWKFDGPDKYLMTLWEGTAISVLEPLGTWEYIRSERLVEKESVGDGETPKLSDHFQAFESLLGKTWEAKGERANGNPLHVRSTFEWTPYADYIYSRTVALDEERTHLLDTYIYRHTKDDTLRCLALSERGVVHEGTISVLEDGALQFDLTRYGGDKTVAQAVRLDLEKDGVLRQRVWGLENDQRALMIDIEFEKR